VLKLLLARQFDPNPVITQEKLALKKYINPKNWHIRVSRTEKDEAGVIQLPCIAAVEIPCF
jgi:hypothetical protein